MSLPREKFREIVFLILYSKDMGDISDKETTDLLSKELHVSRRNVKEAWERAANIFEKLPAIDSEIGNVSLAYRFERIRSVERNVLRLGVYEILYDEEIPPKVAISEAIRLAKKYGTPEAATFVNALLDVVYKTSLGETADREKLEQSMKELQEMEDLASEAAKQQEIKPEAEPEESDQT